MRTRGTSALVLATACSAYNPLYDSDASTEGASGSTSTTTQGSTSTTSASSGSTSSSSGSTSTTSASSGSTSAGTTTSGATSTTTETSTGDPDTTGDVPVTRLQHYADGRCSLPLWCYNDPELFSGQPARWYAQECFTGLTPPYRITRVGYQVAATEGDPSDPRIEVHGFDGAFPSLEPILPPVTLNSADVTPDYHQIPVDFPMAVDRFCIGVVAGDLELETAIGLAVDDVAPPFGQSFYRVNGEGPCDTFTNYRDIAEAKPYPTGQWCIDLDTEPM